MHQCNVNIHLRRTHRIQDVVERHANVQQCRRTVVAHWSRRLVVVQEQSPFDAVLVRVSLAVARSLRPHVCLARTLFLAIRLRWPEILLHSLARRPRHVGLLIFVVFHVLLLGTFAELVGRRIVTPVGRRVVTLFGRQMVKLVTLVGRQMVTLFGRQMVRLVGIQSG